MTADEIERVAMWLAEFPKDPDGVVDLLIKRFSLKTWEARKAVDRARRMRTFRSAHA